MKKIIVIILCAILLSACNKNDTEYVETISSAKRLHEAGSSYQAFRLLETIEIKDNDKAFYREVLDAAIDQLDELDKALK